MAIVTLNKSFKDDKGNVIKVPSGLHNVRVELLGENNFLSIDDGCLISNYLIRFVGSNSKVEIGNSDQVRRSMNGHVIDVGHNCEIKIGDNVTAPFGVYIGCSEGTKVYIGNDTTFALGAIVRSDDSHMIFDVNSKLRVNPSRDVYIGEHVWVGERAAILSGAIVSTGSVVGFQSVVKGQFPNNVVIAGVPAKIIKRNIAWDRAHTHFSKSSGLTFSEYEGTSFNENYWKETISADKK